MIYKKSSFFLMIVCIILGLVYITPKYQKFREAKINKKVISNCELFSNYILKEYELNKKMNLKSKAQEGIELFSTQVQNPVNSKKRAFSDVIDYGVCAVNYESETKSLVLTGLGKDNSILVRFVINPPSFVTYYRD